MHIIYNCPYNIHDIKYISDGSRLEAPTVGNVTELTLVQSSTDKYPKQYDLGHEDLWTVSSDIVT